MHAVLTNFGSTGDILPFVALALELRRHGHRAVLALPPSFESLARGHGSSLKSLSKPTGWMALAGSLKPSLSDETPRTRTWRQ